MTIEETKEAIKVMQAFVDGKKIRVTQRSYPKPIWIDLEQTNNVVWDWKQFVYEIKPEPEEFWIVGMLIYTNPQSASCYARTNNLKVVHVREVV